MMIYTEPVVVNHGMLCWPSGIASYDEPVVLYHGILYQPMVVIHGVLF